MARKTGNHNATNGAIEQLYREIRELRAVTEAGFSQLGADLGQLKKDQSRTERKVGSAAVLADLQFDLITWAVLLSIILLSQAYVSIARNAPRWLQNALPMPPDVEQVEPQQAAAIAPSAAPFSMAALDQSPVAVGDTIAPGLRVTSLFRPPHRPRHNGVDVGGPVGTPYFAPTAVDVRCYWDHGGGGEVAEFVVDGYRWQLLHLDRNTCVAGSHQPRAVIGKLGNTGRSTGPHLHLQIRPAGGGDFINPRRGHLQAVLVPPAPAIAAHSMVDLIKNFEGFHPNPYWDFQQWSWGYGTRAPGQNGTITREQAHQELVAYLDRNCLPHIAPLGLADHKQAALASLCYNLGPEQFTRSHTFQQARAGNHQAAATGFMNWTRANGEQLPGLVNRRRREQAVFLGK